MAMTENGNRSYISGFMRLFFRPQQDYYSEIRGKYGPRQEVFCLNKKDGEFYVLRNDQFVKVEGKELPIDLKKALRKASENRNHIFNYQHA